MVLIVCFGKQFSVQFSEEQLEPLKVNCVSMSFFPSVALMSDCGPVKILNASNGFPFCRKSFKVQYPFTCTSVTRAHIEKTLLTVLNNGKALHFIWSFLKSEPNECFVNYPLLLKIYLHCLITECKFDALNTGSRGDVFVVRTSKPVENLWKNHYLIALQFRYTFYRPQTKRPRARKIGSFLLLGTSGDVPCASKDMACGYWFSKVDLG